MSCAQQGMQAPPTAPPSVTYEDVEQELAVCKLVLYNTYTADVLADLLKMYANLMPHHKGSRPLQQPYHVQAETQSELQATDGPRSPANTQITPNDTPSATKTDASTQTDGVARVPDAASNSSDEASSSEQLRWDLMFYHPEKEEAFVAALHNMSLSTDLMQSLLLLALLGASAFRQVDSMDTLQRAFVAVLTIVATIAGAGLLGPCRRWYSTHREALVVALRVLLALFALPAGQAMLGRYQSSSSSPVGILTSIALWAVPAVTIRVRFTVHIVVHLALLSAMLTSAACHHMSSGAESVLPLLGPMTALVTFGFLLPTAAVYLTELRHRRCGLLAVLPKKTVLSAKRGYY